LASAGFRSSLIKKGVAMNFSMRKSVAVLPLALGASALSLCTHAATLSYGDVLTIAAGIPSYDANGNFAGVVSGSWFGCDCNGNDKLDSTEKVSPLAQGSTGIVIGVATLPGASHGGTPVPGDTNAIDAPYSFFGNTGSDFTSIGITGSTASGLDMSGWGWTWNGVSVALGTSPWASVWGDGFLKGVGNFVWDGVRGHAYTLDYHATTPLGDVSGFGGVGFAWHFEGVVAVPEASTYAMMLSGLGLVGLAARRRKQV
jgi:hypothetical protein